MEFYLTVLLVRINDDKEKIVRYLIVLLLFQSQLAFAVIWPGCDRVEVSYDSYTRLYTNTMYFSLHEYEYPKEHMKGLNSLPPSGGGILHVMVAAGKINSGRVIYSQQYAPLPANEIVWKSTARLYQPVITYISPEPQGAFYEAMYMVVGNANLWAATGGCGTSGPLPPPPPPPEPLKCFTTIQDMLFDFGTIAIGTVPKSKTLQLGVQCTGPQDGMLKGRVVSTSGSTPVSLGGGTATLRVDGDTPGSKYFTFKYGTTSIPIQVDIRNVRAGKWSASTVLSLNFD